LPEGEDYVFPRPATGETRAEESRRIEEAWAEVLTGHADSAEKAFLKLLARRPGLVSAETGLAYARLRARRYEAAWQGFEQALERRPDYLPALVGGASAALRRGQPEAALGLLHRAQAADPKDGTVLRRLAGVKLQVTERRVAAGRAALASGDATGAAEEYRRALEAAPELGALRIELADLLVGRGDAAGAAAVLEGDPEGDRQVLLRLGEVQTSRGQPAAALEAYRRILVRDPRDAEARKRGLEARLAAELQRMPEEYRRIFAAPRITRADLAALLSVKVGALARLPAADPEVAVDISGSWAREHILKALAFDLMEVYPNHTFQPGALVRRGDLARAAARVLGLAKYPNAVAPTIRDMSTSNLFHTAAGRVVAAGLMDLTAQGAFEPWRLVSGPDAAAVIDSLDRLVRP
jgi:tetratricopeptide (TPR) repeat protein